MRCCVSCSVVSKSQRLLVVVAHVTWGNRGIAQKNGTLQIPRLADKEAASGRPSGNRKRRACEEQLSPLSEARGPAGLGLRGEGIPLTSPLPLKGKPLASMEVCGGPARGRAKRRGLCPGGSG